MSKTYRFWSNHAGLFTYIFRGYDMVTYLKQIILLSKARVVPLKPITIPRLELTAAVLAAKMDQMLRNEPRL